MADIDSLLAQILSAKYGRDVRQSIHDSIEGMNDELEEALENQLLEIDPTLTESGSAADAKVVGDRLNDMFIESSEISEVLTG